MRLQATGSGGRTKLHRNSLNLYKFIRLVLGEYVADRQIARRWRMNEKNFHEFKTGVYPVPRLSKLEELAEVLGVNRHLVCQVAGGTPARKVYDLIRRNDLHGQMRLISRQLDEAYDTLTRSEKHYREVFNNITDAVFVVDVRSGKIIDCNNQSIRLLGCPKMMIIGRHQSQLHPPQYRAYYKNLFYRQIKNGQLNKSTRVEVIRQDGTIIPAVINASLLRINGQEVIIGVFRDIRQTTGKTKY